MDEEVVLHIHNGILLSYKKEHIWVSSNEVDETGAYYTEWSKPERKTPIQYTVLYMEFQRIYMEFQCIYMEFRKMVTISLYARQQKKHRCKEQTYGEDSWEFLGQQEDQTSQS